MLLLFHSRCHCSALLPFQVFINILISVSIYLTSHAVLDSTGQEQLRISGLAGMVPAVITLGELLDDIWEVISAV